MSFDAASAATPARQWRDDSRWIDAPAFDLESIESLVVIAAHPDDETLGVGGIIHRCAARGIPVHVVIVTDGAASHPDDSLMPSRRAREALAALGHLAPSADVTMLGFADGATREHRGEISTQLRRVLDSAPRGSFVLAPWRRDGHRDHRVVGEIAAELVSPALFGEYPIWMWHWADPDHDEVDWSKLRVVTIDTAVKQRAITAYHSQVTADAPIVSRAVLEACETGKEFVIVDSDPVGAYLDGIYARHDDPWRVESRWYEQRKRALTLASLPARRYRRALELGCSIGVLTAELADRCEELVAVDLSAAAVDRARKRVAGRAAVEVRRLDIRESFPPGAFDLVVMSEVGYYFSVPRLDRVLDEIEQSIGDRGTLLACHWRHPVAQHTLTGDEVHEVIAARGLPRLSRHDEADFVIDVYSRDACSVAQHEGIA